MTKLTKPVSRETPRFVGKRAIIITIAPAGGSQAEALIEIRLKGKLTGYLVALSDLYRYAALWHGAKEKAARSAAKKNGRPWRYVREEFRRANRINPRVNVIKESPANDETNGD